MLLSQLPTKLQMAFAKNAGPSYKRTVPVASQIGIADGAASYNDGFPPLTTIPPSAGGVNPSIEDFNGVLEELSALLVWYSAGGSIVYDSTFQASIGGYPKNAVIASATVDGLFWRSTTDNNVTNPDAGGAGWAKAYAPPAGTVLPYAGGPIPDGYIVIPTTLTLLSTTTYPELFAAIGYAWGGSGGSFGLPYLAVGYVPVQNNIGTLSHGHVIEHQHTTKLYTSPGVGAAGGATPIVADAGSTTSTTDPITPSGVAGADNLAAGMGHKFIIKY